MSQPSGAERMFASMLDYLRTPTWDGSRRTLLDHPELTNEAGYALLSIIASDPETVARVYPHIGRVEREALIRQHHGLLGRCRQVGVHRAFEELADEATMMRKWEAIISAGTADAAEAALAAFRAIGQPEEARPRQAHDRRHPDTQTAHSRLRRRLMAIGVAACAIAIMSTIAVVLSRDGDVGSSASSAIGSDPPVSGALEVAAAVPTPPPYGDAPTVGPDAAPTASSAGLQTHAAPGIRAPSVPSNVTVTAISGDTIRVRWIDNSTNEAAFEVNNGDHSATIGANVTSYDWGGLTPGTYMCFRVRAVNSAGVSRFAPTSSPFYRCTTTPVAATPDPPAFVYPTDGQSLGFDGAYMFKVTAVSGASGYLYGFFQNGSMVWENYRGEGRLSGTEYAIWPATEAHSRFNVGDVEVWVRALVDGQWTEARIVTIQLANG